MNTFTAPHVVLAARLPIGKPESNIRSDINGEQELDAFAQNLRRHSSQLAIPNTADCMDDRPTTALGDGTEDPEILRRRVVWQLPGGLVLATVKAAKAANAAYLRNAKNMQAAYETTYNLLHNLGYEDGGHEHCGASTFVEASAADPIAPEVALPIISGLFTVDEQAVSLLYKNYETKRQFLEDGFYSGWDPDWHQDFLLNKVPHNFSYLQGEHKANGIYIMKQAGLGFAKNAFFEETGQESFGVTLAAAVDLSQKVGTSPEERMRLLLGFGEDLLSVSDKLIAPDMPVFAEAA